MNSPATTSACTWDREIDRLISGTLTEESLGAVESHLEECSRCRARVEDLKDLSTLLIDLRKASDVQSQTLVDVAPPAARLNELLSDYDVLTELGRGGMGIVYKARQVSLNRLVALKVLPALMGAVRPNAMLRFKREAALAASLKHSNIIGVYDFGEVDGTLYYAMELVQGRSLRDLLAEARQAGGIEKIAGMIGSSADSGSGVMQTPAGTSGSSVLSKGSVRRATSAYYRQVSQWIADVADALEYAHEHGVIHRDIKPSNLLMGSNGRLMISDFGLARPSADISLTASRDLLGTSRYMSPERVDGSLGPIDRRTDVYALGATFYEMLTLQPLFSGCDDHAVLHRVVHDEPRSPRSVAREVPRELETICLKAVAKKPIERYASAVEFANDLRRWTLGVPILAQRPTALMRAVKFVRRHRTATALSALLIGLAVLCGATFAAYRASQVAAERDRAALVQRDESLAVRRADELLESGRFLDALSLVDENLSRTPESSRLRRLRAETLISLDRESEAMEILIGLAKSHPDDLGVHFQICGMLTDRLTANYRYMAPTSMIRTMPESERLALLEEHEAAVHRLGPDSAESLLLRGIQEHDAQAAIEMFGQAIAADPSMVVAFTERSNCLERLGDFPNMLLDAERATALRPRWASAQALRGRALENLKRYDEAVAAFAKAIELEPEAAVHWHSRGLVQCSLGRYGEAVADASRAIELEPRFTYAFACRARGHAGLGQTDNAIEDLRRALLLSPDDIELYLMRAYILMNAGRTDEAIADCDRVITLKPDDARAFGSLGTARLLKQEYARGVAALSESLERNPADATVYRNRAFAQQRLGHLREAVNDYTKANDLDPGVRGNVLNRAELLFALNDYSNAIQDYSVLLKSDPDNEALLMKRGAAYELAGAPSFALADYRAVASHGGRAGAFAKLWAYVLARQSGETPPLPGPLAENDEWAVRHSQVLQFFGGQISADELLRGDPSDEAKADAHYYIGVDHLFANRPDQARKAFEAALGVGLKKESFSTAFARARLKSLDAAASKN